MSLISRRLARAKARKIESEQPETLTPFQAVGIPLIPIKRPVPTLSNLPPCISRGRPRSSLPRRELELKPVEAWVHERLTPVENCAVMVGTKRRQVVVVNHRRVVTQPDYRNRATLVDDYITYLKAHNFQPRIPGSFTTLVLKACLELGWSVRRSHSGQLRRSILVGVNIKGQPFWDGEDFDPSLDPPRWKPRPKST